MNVTVAICTWNRAKLLDQTLAAMCNLTVPVGVKWELLVVNNRCTDDTDSVIARHQMRLPLRRLFEPEPGLSNARNCAVAAAQGDLMLWTDDDVLIERDWLEAYVAAASKWPDAGYFGGRIEPWYESSPPKWIQPNISLLQGLLVIRDLGSSERPFCVEEQPWGANMAFRLEILRRHPFDPNLGRKGSESMLGEETVLIRHLKADGVQGIWVPSAKVRHYIPRERVSRRYLWSYNHGIGRTDVRMGESSEPVANWGGVPRWAIRRALECWLSFSYKSLWSGTDWVLPYVEAAYLAGVIAEMRCLKRSSVRACMAEHARKTVGTE